MQQFIEHFLASRSFSELIIWNVTEATQNFTLSPLGNSLAYPSMTKLKNTNLLALGNTGLDNAIKIWNYPTRTLIFGLRGDSNRAQMYSPVSLSNQLLASGSYGPTSFIWNITSGVEKYELSSDANSLITNLYNRMFASAKGFIDAL